MYDWYINTIGITAVKGAIWALESVTFDCVPEPNSNFSLIFDTVADRNENNTRSTDSFNAKYRTVKKIDQIETFGSK